jgi:hypothetical protein
VEALQERKKSGNEGGLERHTNHIHVQWLLNTVSISRYASLDRAVHQLCGQLSQRPHT